MTQNPSRSFNRRPSMCRGNRRGLRVAAGWMLFTCLADNGATLGAQPIPLRLLVSNGVKGALEAVRPGCEAQLGVPLAAEFGTSNALRAQAESGTLLLKPAHSFPEAFFQRARMPVRARP